MCRVEGRGRVQVTTASAGHVLFASPHHAPSPGPAQDGFRGAKVDRCCVRGSAEVRQGQSSLHPSAPAPLVRRVPKRVARPRPECMRADLLVRLFSTRVAARPPPRTLRLRLRPQLPTPPPTCAAPATCFSRPSATNASHCSCTKPTWVRTSNASEPEAEELTGRGGRPDYSSYTPSVGGHGRPARALLYPNPHRPGLLHCLLCARVSLPACVCCDAVFDAVGRGSPREGRLSRRADAHPPIRVQDLPPQLVPRVPPAKVRPGSRCRHRRVRGRGRRTRPAHLDAIARRGPRRRRRVRRAPGRRVPPVHPPAARVQVLVRPPSRFPLPEGAPGARLTRPQRPQVLGDQGRRVRIRRNPLPLLRHPCLLADSPRLLLRPVLHHDAETDRTHAAIQVRLFLSL